MLVAVFVELAPKNDFPSYDIVEVCERKNNPAGCLPHVYVGAFLPLASANVDSCLTVKAGCRRLAGEGTGGADYPKLGIKEGRKSMVIQVREIQLI